MTIYILLTRSQTIVSRIVYLLTRAKYTHASIAIDEQLNTLCSFTRKQPETMLPAGLAFESLSHGYFSTHSNVPCILFSMNVDEQTYGLLKDRLEYMLSRDDIYHYSVMGLIWCRLGLNITKRNHYFCSQFVAELLQDCCAITLPKEPALMHPCDFLSLDELQCIFEGKLYKLIDRLNAAETN